MFRDRFLFVGERLAVDLLNTVIVQDGALRDLLLEPGSAGAWAEATGVGGHDVLPGDARELRNFRELLRRGLVHWADTGRASRELVAALNGRVARDPEIDELMIAAGKVIVQRRRAGAAVDRVYGAVARSAADLLLHGDPGRLRKCANPECVLRFYDVSKAGRRRWCSMRTCGGRAKARAFRSRGSADRRGTTSRRQSP